MSSTPRIINMLHSFLTTIHQQKLPESTPEEVNKFLLKMYNEFTKATMKIQNVNKDKQYRTLLSCCCIYIDAIFNYVAEFTFTDVNLRNFLKLLQIFLYVYEIKNPRVDLVEILHNVLDIITINQGPVWCSREVIYTLNKCYTNADLKLCRDFIKRNTFLLYKLIDLLSSCGDFDYQFQIIKLIHNICSRNTIEKEVKNFFPENKEFCEKFLAINDCRFDQDVRDFLCALNKPIEKVFSFQCKIISLDNIPLSEMNNWIDFNKNSDTVSLYCHKNLFLNLPSSSSTTGENGDLDILYLPVNHVDFITYKESELKHRSEKYIYIQFKISKPLLTRNSTCENKYEAKTLHLVMLKSSDSEMLVYYVLPLMFNVEMINANTDMDLMGSSGVFSMVTNRETAFSVKSGVSSISDCTKKIQECLATYTSDKSVTSLSLNTEEIIDLTESDSETLCPTEHEILTPQRDNHNNENSVRVSSNTLEYFTALSLDDLNNNSCPTQRVSLEKNKSDKKETLKTVTNRSTSVVINSRDPRVNKMVQYDWCIRDANETIDLTNSDSEDFSIIHTAQRSQKRICAPKKEFLRMSVSGITEESEYNTALSDIAINQLSNKINSSMCSKPSPPKTLNAHTNMKKKTAKKSDKENNSELIVSKEKFDKHLASIENDRDLLLSLTSPMDSSSYFTKEMTKISEINQTKTLYTGKRNTSNENSSPVKGAPTKKVNETKIKIVSNIIIDTNGALQMETENTDYSTSENTSLSQKQNNENGKKDSLLSWFEYIVSTNSASDDIQVIEETKQFDENKQKTEKPKTAPIEKHKETPLNNEQIVSCSKVEVMLKSLKPCSVILKRLSPNKFQRKNEESTSEDSEELAQNDSKNNKTQLILQLIKPCIVNLKRLLPHQINNEKLTNKLVENEIGFDEKSDNEPEEADGTCKTQDSPSSVKKFNELMEELTLEDNINCEVLDDHQTQITTVINEVAIADENMDGQSNKQSTEAVSVFSQDTVIIMHSQSQSQSQPLEASDGTTNIELHHNSPQRLENIIQKMKIVDIKSPTKVAEDENVDNKPSGDLNESNEAVEDDSTKEEININEIEAQVDVGDIESPTKVAENKNVDIELRNDLNRSNETVDDSNRAEIDISESEAQVDVNIASPTKVADNKNMNIELSSDLNKSNETVVDDSSKAEVNINEIEAQVDVADNEVSFVNEREVNIEDDLQLNEKNSVSNETKIINETEVPEEITQSNLECDQIDVSASGTIESVFKKPIAVKKKKKKNQDYDMEKSRFFENDKLHLSPEIFKKNSETIDSAKVDGIDMPRKSVNNIKDIQTIKKKLPTEDTTLNEQTNKNDSELMKILNKIQIQTKTKEPNHLKKTKKRKLHDQDDQSHLQNYEINDDIDKSSHYNSSNKKTRSSLFNIHKHNYSTSYYEPGKIKKIPGLTSTSFIEALTKAMEMDKITVQNKHSKKRIKKANTKRKSSNDLNLDDKSTRSNKRIKITENILISGPKSQNNTSPNEVIFYQLSNTVKIFNDENRNHNQETFEKMSTSEKLEDEIIEGSENGFDNTVKEDRKKNENIRVTVSNKFIRTIITSLKNIAEACITELNGSHEGMDSEFRTLCKVYDALT